MGQDHPADDRTCLCCGGRALVRVRPYRSESPAGKRLFRGAVIDHCEGCGLCQLDPVPDDDALEAYYAEDYRAGRRYGSDASNPATFPHDNAFFYHRGRSVTALLREHLREPPRTILDIGAGYGHVLHALREAFPEAKCFAHEYSRPCIEHLTNVGMQVVTGPLADALATLPELDLVVSTHVVEHLRDPVATLALARTRMSRGATLFVEVPHMGLGLLKGYPDSPWAPRHDEPHVTFFDVDSLSRVLEAAGFTPLLVRTAGPLYTPVSALRYRLPPLLPTLRRVVPRSIMGRLRRTGSRHATLEHLAPLFDAYDGNRIWVRSVSRVA
jgi:hypothetical protein